MSVRKNILLIVGSATPQSSNLQLARAIQTMGRDQYTIIENLGYLPHFNPLLSSGGTPEAVQQFRNLVAQSDGIMICTPEYIFSLPAVLKNALEWCVATTVFSGKPAGLITASAQGAKAHEELQLIIKTLEARFTKETTLLIQGIKSRFDEQGQLNDGQTAVQLQDLVYAFEDLVRL